MVQILTQMRNLVFLFSLIIFNGLGKTMANEADLFSYDEVNIENQMVQLDLIEDYVMNNPGMTLTLMKTGENHQASRFSDLNGTEVFSQKNESVLGIPGFLWGCVGGWVGILVVYLNGPDPYEVKQATIGCIVGSVAIAGCYAAYIVWIAAFFSVGINY